MIGSVVEAMSKPKLLYSVGKKKPPAMSRTITKRSIEPRMLRGFMSIVIFYKNGSVARLALFFLRKIIGDCDDNDSAHKSNDLMPE